jgi:hypothetical protein
MLRSAAIATIVFVSLVLASPAAASDISQIAGCQKRIAGAGATFAKRVITATLKCTNAVAECQIQCEQGVFGPPCDPAPPPCCDPDDRTSNASFGACMDEADALCAAQEVKIANYEQSKRDKIINSCSPLTQDELCGAQGNGLNFATLNAGCLALNPGYVCNLNNLVDCVGGPLERKLVDQISAVLDPRAGEAIAALGLESAFPDIPVARKARGEVAEGTMDVYSLTGQAGDEIVVRVKTRDDNGNGTANLHPLLNFIGNDGSTPVADTDIKNVPCPVPNVCGSTCPQFKRSLPFSGTFYLAVRAADTDACGGGKYKLIVVSPGGAVPTLVGDDVTGPGPAPGS